MFCVFVFRVVCFFFNQKTAYEMRMSDWISDVCSSVLFDLNLLRIFDAIFAKGGVSAAARHLHLSQPAISHALARLRTQFDDPLFVRQGNRLVPTSAARAIAGPVREALRSQERRVGYRCVSKCRDGCEP